MWVKEEFFFFFNMRILYHIYCGLIILCNIKEYGVDADRITYLVMRTKQFFLFYFSYSRSMVVSRGKET